MNKRNYRATHVKQVNWRNVIQNTAGKTLVLAIDVAKEERFAMLMDADRDLWRHAEGGSWHWRATACTR